jgi:hypothetical protein
MDEQQAYQELKLKLSDQKWRLNHLYTVINKQGQKVPFVLNYFQKFLFENLWYLNVILKARQLGMSTFIVIYLLDVCLFNSNRTAGIIDYTLDDAIEKLNKARIAYENLPQMIKNEIRIVKDNTQTIEFSNGSKLTADTTFRGATIQYLHISELASICKYDPIRAGEIVTGALNSVAIGQFVFIESTAQDGEGAFFDICQRAEKSQLARETLSKLDYKFHFFPWWKNEDYQLEKPKDFVFSRDVLEYFRILEQTTGHKLTDNQIYFYIKKKESLGEEIKKEYPSFSKEAFESSTDDKYYHSIVLELYSKHQICEFGVEKGIEVCTDWDLGIDDYTSIIFSQVVGKEIRIVDFLEGSGEIMEYYAEELKKKDYLLGTCFLPHDANHRTLTTAKTPYSVLASLGFKCQVIPASSVEMGINEVRKLLPNMWFRQSTTEKLVDHISKYAKKWSPQLGKYTGPNHNEHSHASDALRGLATRYRELKVTPKKYILQNRRQYTPINSITGY